MEMLSEIARKIEEIWGEYNKDKQPSGSGCRYEMRVRDPIFNTRKADGSRVRGAWLDVVFIVTLYGYTSWWRRTKNKQVLKQISLLLKEMIDKNNNKNLSCNPVYGLLSRRIKISTGVEIFKIEFTITCKEPPVLPLKPGARPHDIFETYHRLDLIPARSHDQ